MHHNFIFLSISFNFSALVLGLTPIRSNVIRSDAIRIHAIRSDASSDVPFYSSKCKGLARGNFDMPKNHKKKSTKSDRLSQIHKSGVFAQKKKRHQQQDFLKFQKAQQKGSWNSKKKMNPCLSKVSKPEKKINLPNP